MSTNYLIVMKLTKRRKNKWDQILHRVIELKDYVKFGICKFLTSHWHQRHLSQYRKILNIIIKSLSTKRIWFFWSSYQDYLVWFDDISDEYSFLSLGVKPLFTNTLLDWRSINGISFDCLDEKCNNDWTWTCGC